MDCKHKPEVFAVAGTAALHPLVYVTGPGVVSSCSLVWTNFYLLDSFAVEVDSLKGEKLDN